MTQKVNETWPTAPGQTIPVETAASPTARGNSKAGGEVTYRIPIPGLKPERV